MKSMILQLIFVLMVYPCFAQREHLEPVENSREYESVLKEYYDSLFLKLYEGFSETPYARYTSVPSFSKEFAFSVETIDNKHYIISNRFSKNFRYSKSRNKVRLTGSKTEISRILYLKIGELFQLVAEQMKNPESETIGLDGTTYYFATTSESGHVLTGKTWSPNKNTRLGKVIRICNKLFSLRNPKKIQEARILKEIKILVAELT